MGIHCRSRDRTAPVTLLELWRRIASSPPGVHDVVDLLVGHCIFFLIEMLRSVLAFVSSGVSPFIGVVAIV
jgi:hypothetical protein